MKWPRLKWHNDYLLVIFVLLILIWLAFAFGVVPESWYGLPTPTALP